LGGIAPKLTCEPKRPTLEPTSEVVMVREKALPPSAVSLLGMRSKAQRCVRGLLLVPRVNVVEENRRPAAGIVGWSEGDGAGTKPQPPFVNTGPVFLPFGFFFSV